MKGWIYPSQDNNSNKSDYSLVIYTRQDTKKEKLSSGEQAPCKWVFSPLGECSRNLSVSVYQLVMLWEAVFGFSEFFWRLFQSICPFHDGWFMSAPIHTTLSVQQFLTRSGMTPIPHPPYPPDLTLSNFFCFPRWIKPSKGNFLLMWKRWTQKWQKH